MPVSVVDLLEAIKIDPKYCERTMSMGIAILQLFAKAVTVGEARESVGLCQLRYTLGAALLYGDVLVNVDPAASRNRPGSIA